MNTAQAIRIASLGILLVPNIDDIYKLLLIYFVDSIDCIPGPCPDYKYQSIDKLIDFLSYIFILVYLWPKTQNWFRWVLVATLVFRLIGLSLFYKTRDETVLVKFPDYFREFTVVNLLFPGNLWWLLGVLVTKPFVEMHLHARNAK